MNNASSRRNESSQVCKFSAKKNLYRLRKCLLGPVREVVSALLNSATIPGLMISTLELQFENPDIILSRTIMDIKKLQPLPPECYKNIVYLFQYWYVTM